MNAREAAYLAVFDFLRSGRFISDSLEQWQRSFHPSSLDFSFAYEVASGTVRMAISLDYIALHLTANHKLSLKVKERALLRTAVYQHVFMQKVPIYAIANETIQIAKKYCHETFVKFLNALLRHMAEGVVSLPEGNSSEELSVHYSYPQIFVDRLLKDYEPASTLAILQAGNCIPSVMARIRSENIQQDLFSHTFEVDRFCMGVLGEGSLASVVSSSQYYIQNATPVALVAELAKQSDFPRKILDLCAAPGGKLLAAHDLFPQAELFANDVSQDKVAKLNENLSKYGVEAEVKCGRGEEYPLGEEFDLIILDVPCSNSGVLNKRPEARWRLLEENLKEIEEKQLGIIKRAVELIGKRGVIWYLTCSILKSENETLVAKACGQYGLKVQYMKTILPNGEGWDGGFGACLAPV